MIKLTVLTPKGIVLDEEIRSILIPAINGPLLLEKGYTPSIVTCLDAGVAKVNFDTRIGYYATFKGVAHMKHDRIVLLCESFEDGYEIDMARAMAKRDRNLDIIAKKDPNDDVERAKISLAKQLARIKAKTLGEGGKA